jgi:hypothetical protein
VPIQGRIFFFSQDPDNLEKKGQLMEEQRNNGSLGELERIEGNYYKMDLFVACSLVLFTAWDYLFSRESLGWAIFLGVLAVLFFIRGIANWRRRPGGAKNLLQTDSSDGKE